MIEMKEHSKKNENHEPVEGFEGSAMLSISKWRRGRGEFR
jgi:hypothetical protein